MRDDKYQRCKDSHNGREKLGQGHSRERTVSKATIAERALFRVRSRFVVGRENIGMIIVDCIRTANREKSVLFTRPKGRRVSEHNGIDLELIVRSLHERNFYLFVLFDIGIDSDCFV